MGYTNTQKEKMIKYGSRKIQRMMYIRCLYTLG